MKKKKEMEETWPAAINAAGPVSQPTDDGSIAFYEPHAPPTTTPTPTHEDSFGSV
jgi:hypothetical protein